MTPGQWKRVREIFHSAAGLPTAEADEFVCRACSGDSELQVEVMRMLREHRQTGPMDHPPTWGRFGNGPIQLHHLKNRHSLKDLSKLTGQEHRRRTGSGDTTGKSSTGRRSTNFEPTKPPYRPVSWPLQRVPPCGLDFAALISADPRRDKDRGRLG